MKKVVTNILILAALSLIARPALSQSGIRGKVIDRYVKTDCSDTRAIACDGLVAEWFSGTVEIYRPTQTFPKFVKAVTVERDGSINVSLKPGIYYLLTGLSADHSSDIIFRGGNRVVVTKRHYSRVKLKVVTKIPRTDEGRLPTPKHPVECSGSSSPLKLNGCD